MTPTPHMSGDSSNIGHVQDVHVKMPGLQSLRANRIWYALIFFSVLIYSFISGERVLYLTVFALLALPIIGFIVSFTLIRGIRISQIVQSQATKGVWSVFTVRIFNRTPMPFGNVECVFFTDFDAIEAESRHRAILRPFLPSNIDISFKGRFRGHYPMGISSISVVDMTGLIRLRRRFLSRQIVTITPLVPDISSFPLAMNLLSQATSRHDARDEDYATISDIRPYDHTDSIKRVHWKLTAKRGEWLVKVFQSNALGRVYVVFDNARAGKPGYDTYALEDAMTEVGLGLSKFCLNRGMPVDIMFTDTMKAAARTHQEFDTIYTAASIMEFSAPILESASMLRSVLNDTTGYVNAVIITTVLTPALHELIAAASGSGHMIITLYFPPVIPDKESETIFGLISQTKSPAMKITSSEGESSVYS